MISYGDKGVDRYGDERVDRKVNKKGSYRNTGSEASCGAQAVKEDALNRV
jgi:hypothetical protein